MIDQSDEKTVVWRDQIKKLKVLKEYTAQEFLNRCFFLLGNEKANEYAVNVHSINGWKKELDNNEAFGPYLDDCQYISLEKISYCFEEEVIIHHLGKLDFTDKDKDQYLDIYNMRHAVFWDEENICIPKGLTLQGFIDVIFTSLRLKDTDRLYIVYREVPDKKVYNVPKGYHNVSLHPVLPDKKRETKARTLFSEYEDYKIEDKLKKLLNMEAADLKIKDLINTLYLFEECIWKITLMSGDGDYLSNVFEGDKQLNRPILLVHKKNTKSNIIMSVSNSVPHTEILMYKESQEQSKDFEFMPTGPLEKKEKTLAEGEAEEAKEIRICRIAYDGKYMQKFKIYSGDTEESFLKQLSFTVISSISRNDIKLQSLNLVAKTDADTFRDGLENNEILFYRSEKLFRHMKLIKRIDGFHGPMEKRSKRIKIFWDIDTCLLPAAKDPCVFITKLHERHYASCLLKEINIMYSSNSKAEVTEFLKKCPSNFRQEKCHVKDKLIYIMDTITSDENLVFISGDPDICQRFGENQAVIGDVSYTAAETRILLKEFVETIPDEISLDFGKGLQIFWEHEFSEIIEQFKKKFNADPTFAIQMYPPFVIGVLEPERLECMKDIFNGHYSGRRVNAAIEDIAGIKTKNITSCLADFKTHIFESKHNANLILNSCSICKITSTSTKSETAFADLICEELKNKHGQTKLIDCFALCTIPFDQVESIKECYKTKLLVEKIIGETLPSKSVMATQPADLTFEEAMESDMINTQEKTSNQASSYIEFPYADAEIETPELTRNPSGNETESVEIMKCIIVQYKEHDDVIAIIKSINTNSYFYRKMTHTVYTCSTPSTRDITYQKIIDKKFSNVNIQKAEQSTFRDNRKGLEGAQSANKKEDHQIVIQFSEQETLAKLCKDLKSEISGDIHPENFTCILCKNLTGRDRILQAIKEKHMNGVIATKAEELSEFKQTVMDMIHQKKKKAQRKTKQ